MSYVGLQEQIRKNNMRSMLLLIAFPLLVFLAVYAVMFFALDVDFDEVNYYFIQAVPFVLIVVGVWFAIAYFSHSSMVNLAAGSHTLERKEHMRVYNLTENLCMSVGMPMPKLQIMETPALNAFASGLNDKTYTVTLTRGIIDKLNDEELEGVIAHELMHIRNRDVRLLVVTIIFVGIFAFATQLLFRSFIYSGGGRSKNNKNDGKLVVVALLVAVVAYLLTVLFKFALSRKREYLADAGAAEMTKKPWALASALRKISGNSSVESVKSDDIKEMFIDNTPDKTNFSIASLFSTHPPIEKRVKFLEQV
ncbi:MAG: M48 family metallopeptidase [Flavobacteriales bacterium]